MTEAWARDAMTAVGELGVDLTAYLPDSTVEPLAAEIDDDPDIELVRLAREEQGVGVVSGAWLTGSRGLLVCQSSGLANTFNAFASLSYPARLPFLAVVTRRGDLGEFNLAQVPAGYSMPAMLDEMGIRNHVIEDPKNVEDRIRMAGETAFSTRTPYVVMLDSTVTGYKSEGDDDE